MSLLIERSNEVSTKWLGKSLHQSTLLWNFRTLEIKEMILQGLGNRIASKFSSITSEARRKWSNAFKILREYHSSKPSFWTV